MVDQTKKFLVTEIDKAVNHRFSVLGNSAAQNLVKFLLINNRKHVAEQIKQKMSCANKFDEAVSSQDFEAELRLEEKQMFIDAVIATSEDIFKLPTLIIGKDIDGNLEPKADYKVRLKKFYEEQGLVNNLKLMREYKKLVNELFRSFGYKTPDYTLFGQYRHEDLEQTTNIYDLDDPDEILITLVDFAAENYNKSKDGFILPYQYNRDSNVLEKLDQQDLAKLRTKKLKNILFYFSIFAGLVLGLGEAFTPAKFYLTLFTGMGMTGVGFPFAATAFIAAICVNSILMQGAVYDTFKDLVFKSRFTKNAKGHELSTKKKILNITVWGLSVFAALTIASLSFIFSGFGVLPAAFVSLMTFICFKSLLTNQVMKMMDMKVIKSALNFFTGLITEPFNEFKANRFNIFNAKGRSSLFKLVVNSLAASAMVGFGTTVVAASFVMFTSLISGLPILVSAFGISAPLVANGIVALAELTLGTFFVINVSTFVNTVRQAVLGLPSALKSAKDSLLTPKPAKVESSENYINHSLRTARVATGYVAGVVLASFAFLNAGGFGFGYKALFKNPLVGNVSGLSYVMSSVAGNLIPALKKSLAGLGFTAYSRQASENYNAMREYQPAKPYLVNNTVPKDVQSGLTGFSESGHLPKSTRGPVIPLLNLSRLAGTISTTAQSDTSVDATLEAPFVPSTRQIVGFTSE